jgi:hypothetical protein
VTARALRLRRVGWLVVLGAVGGSVLDSLHTHSGSEVYARPSFFLMSIWTPLIFASTGPTVGLAYALTERLTGRRPGRRVSWAEASAGFAVFTGLYALSGYLPASNAVKLAVLLAGTAGLLAWLAPTVAALGLAVAAAAIGPLLEAALSSTGFFRYTAPDFLGVPMWLAPLYAAGSVAFGVLGEKVMGEGSDRV